MTILRSGKFLEGEKHFLHKPIYELIKSKQGFDF